jgi:hypothetical protein
MSKLLQTGSVIAAITASTAVMGFFFSLLVDKRNRRESKEREREASIRDRREYGSEFRNWADAVVSAMTQALHRWVYGGEIDFALIEDLSALLNRGRLFFLNELRSPDEEDLEFPGVRPRMLDCIYYTYRFIQLDRSARNLSEDWHILFRLQARFIRDAQRVMSLDSPQSTMEQLIVLLRSPDFLDTSQTHKAVADAKLAVDRSPKDSRWSGNTSIDVYKQD